LAAEQARNWAEMSTHKYNFDRQAQEVAALDDISAQDFIAHFEETFFSSTSKRVDLQLTSAAHAEEQNQYKESNATHEVFNLLKRVHVDETIVSFKKRSGLYPDVYKAGYVQFLNEEEKK